MSVLAILAILVISLWQKWLFLGILDHQLVNFDHIDDEQFALLAILVDFCRPIVVNFRHFKILFFQFW